MIYINIFGDYFFDNSNFAKEVGVNYISHYCIEVTDLTDKSTIYSKLADKWISIFHYVNPIHLRYILNELRMIPDEDNNKELIRMANEITLNKINKVNKKKDNQLNLF